MVGVGVGGSGVGVGPVGVGVGVFCTPPMAWICSSAYQLSPAHSSPLLS